MHVWDVSVLTSTDAHSPRLYLYKTDVLVCRGDQGKEEYKKHTLALQRSPSHGVVPLFSMFL